MVMMTVLQFPPRLRERGRREHRSYTSGVRMKWDGVRRTMQESHPAQHIRQECELQQTGKFKSGRMKGRIGISAYLCMQYI